MRKLEIILDFFKLAFDRDEDFHDAYPQTAFMDRNTGEILWVYENDDEAEFDGGISSEDNRERRQQIASDKDKYIEIPGRSHGEQHSILKEFLDSDWTDNLNNKNYAKDCYFKSIGGWKEKVDEQDVIHAYQTYKHNKLKELAEEYLRSNGIDPIWK